MPTAQTLAHEGVLVAVDPEDLLDQGELPERQLFLMPRVAVWIEEYLEGLESDGYYDGSLTPEQQLFRLFKNFVSGKNLLDPDLPPKQMRPRPCPIWELRTADLRIFGWFCQHGTFLASAIETKAKCLEHNLYPGFKNQCYSDVASLDLDDPKYLMGEGADVL
jgi:hypothetical protein